MLDEQIIQPEPAPSRPIALRYGLLTALALFFAGLLLQFTGIVDPVVQKGSAISTMISIAVLFGGMYLALKEYKNENGNRLTFGKGLNVGILTSVVIALAMIVLTYLQVAFINTDIMDQIFEMQIAQMEDRGMDDAAIEQAMSVMGFMRSPWFIAVAAGFGQFIFGFIMALIAAAIHQNVKSGETA
jgi:hypothetical protein